MRYIAIALIASLNASGVLSQTVTHPARLSAASFSVEVRRGFNASAYASRDLSCPEKWLENLNRTLNIGELIHSNSNAFVLGAQFGLSYRIAQFQRGGQPLAFDQLRKLAVHSTLARLEYEKRKQATRTTDADLVNILHIPIFSFAMWKQSVLTGDNDHTVVDDTYWLSI